MPEPDRSAPFDPCAPAAAPTERLPGGGLLALAPAKLNLSLRVGPAGADGYHNLDSLVAKISLYDRLELRPRRDGEIRLHGADDLGPVERNLVYRAAVAMRAGREELGAEITLTKHISAGAGLGGGSSDAAATLRALNAMWGLGLGDEALGALAQALGSDVPLFLAGPSSRMAGRGEQLWPMPLPLFCALLVSPPLHSATADVYRAYDRVGPGPLDSADRADRLVERLADLPPSQWSALLVNDLQRPAEAVCPEIADWRRAISAATGQSALMTGSGSSLFVLADSEADARRLFDRLGESERPFAHVVTLNGW